MRQAPPLPSNLSTARAKVEEIKVEVCLITRLMGGGARAGEVDERCWLRPPAVKSALRFWWRAGHAHLFSSLADLRREEERLFGSAASFVVAGDGKKEVAGGPGLVEVTVTGASHELKKDIFDPEEPALRGKALNVAYFPASLSEGNGSQLGQVDGAPPMTLRVAWRSHDAESGDREQIENALRLFLLLGGAGARTRRGAGALAVKSEKDATALGIPTTRADVAVFLRTFLRPHRVSGINHSVWCLADAEYAWIARRSDATGEAAQMELLGRLREVRQDRPHPPTWIGAADWGRSHWPEADELRRRYPPGPTWKHQPDPAKVGFPRLALGMPMIVRFKKFDTGPGRDPDAHNLSAIRSTPPSIRLNRFASPLLIRPVRVWEDKKVSYVQVAILGPMTLPADAVPYIERLGKTPTPPSPVPGHAIAANHRKSFDKVVQKFAGYISLT
jgi:CRISPR-associated protein Cmr1